MTSKNSKNKKQNKGNIEIKESVTLTNDRDVLCENL